MGNVCDIQPMETKPCESPSPLETFKRQRKQLEEKLLNVNRAIEALEANPEVTKVLELIARARY